MLKRLMVIIVLLWCTLGCNMWSTPASGWKGATGGEQIEALFWKDVQAKNWAEVDRHLADTFVASGPAGAMDRSGFLGKLQQAAPSEVSLTECSSHLNGDSLIVTCKLRGQRGGENFTSATMSVWQQLKKGWVMVAHAETGLPG